MAPNPASPSLLEQTCKNLRQTLSKSLAGVPAEQLCCDYRNLMGEGIPFRKLGFDSLGSFLSSQPGTCSVKRLPSGGMLVALAGQQQQQQTNQNYRNTRSFAKPKKNIRRPNQQSINWVPPMNGKQPARNGSFHHGEKAGRGEQKGHWGQWEQHGNKKPYREPKLKREGSQASIRRENSKSQLKREKSQTQLRREGSQGQIRKENNQQHSKKENNHKNSKNEKNIKQGTRTPDEDGKESSRTYRNELQTYFSQKNLGVANYKIATMGTKGKERFMATVSVENNQYKTYPDTYPTQAEAEEALASLVLSKLGINNEEEGASVKEAKNLLEYGQRVVELLGGRSNGVWSHQVESEYHDKHGEKLPANWIEKLEEINQIRIESPIPDSIRFIIFSVNKDFFSNLPPPTIFPQDEIWDVFVTIVRSTKSISIRMIGPKLSEMFENLISEMELHYFDKTGQPVVASPEVGKLYAAQVASDWHRVRVLSCVGDTCSCLFVDHGDEDTILMEDLRELDPRFLLVPLQAIQVEMAGLTEFPHSDAILNQLNQKLLGKSLAVKVENRDKLGKRLDIDGQELPRLIFFDTSKEDEDLNINQKLIEMIVSEGSETRLPKAGMEEINVRVTFIMATGDIYVRKEVDEKSSNREITPEGDLAILENESIAERKAIRCRLDGVPPNGHTWSQAATEALRELVSEDEVVTLRVVREQDGCPYVELNVPDSNDGSINFDLSTEFDIFPLAPIEMVKHDSNNNKEELKSISEESEREMEEKIDSFELFSLKTLLPPQIPVKGSYFDLTVTFAVSPDSFVIQPHNQGPSLSFLLEDMNKFYSSKEGVDLAEVPIEPDTSKEIFFAAQLSGGSWHRVEVSNFIPCGSSNQAVVRYVDQGSSALLLISDLRPLHARFRNLPCQAISAGLAGVIPSKDRADWDPEDNYWFNNRVGGKMFVGQVVEQTAESLLLELVDTSHPTEDNYIHKELIMAGRAISR